MPDPLLALGDTSGDGSTIPFIIEEATGNNRIKVTLDNHDAPMGMPREQPAFSLGGENETHTIRLDGRQTPIVHTRFTVWEPVEIHGHIRDTLDGGNGSSFFGRAQNIVKDLQQIFDNQRKCTLSCGPFTWSAFPKKCRIPVEGVSDFTYELKFEVLSRPGFSPPKRDQDQLLESFPYDLAAQARATLAADRVALLAQQILVSTQVALATMFDQVDTALGDTMAAAQAFENAGDKGIAEANTLSARAAQASAQCDIMLSSLSSSDPATSLTTTAQDASASFEAAVYASIADVYATKQDMRRLQYTARQRIRSTTQVYKVAPGDTLESIATTQLGSPARAHDLGYRPQDLVPGKLIRIPA